MSVKKRSFYTLIILLSIVTVPANASQAIDSLKKISEASGDTQERIKIYLRIANLYEKVNPDSAHYFATTALKLSNPKTSPEVMGQLYDCIAYVAVTRDSLYKAREAYLQAFNYYSEAQNWSELIHVYIVLGNIELVRDNLLDALTYYNKGIETAEKYNILDMLPQFYLNIGTIYSRAKSYDDALRYFKLALSALRETSDSTEIGIAYTNLGSVYSSLNKSDSSESNYRKALEMSLALNDHANISLSYMNIGEILSAKNRDKEALHYLHKFFNEYAKIGFEYAGPRSVILAPACVLTGNIYLKLQQYDSALTYLDKGFALAKESSQLSLSAMASKGLASLWEKRSRTDSALYYQKLYNEYYERQQSEDNTRVLAYQAAKFEFDQRAKAAELEKLKADARRNRTYLTLSILIGGLAVATAILFLLVKLARNRLKEAELKKVNLENELEFRNKELTTHVMYQVKNKEFLLKMSEKLKNATLFDNPAYAKMVKEIISEMDTDSSTDSWKEFEIRFQRVHVNFYKNLMDKFPDLSPNELRTCAFLKLNMSTKDIASITYQTVNSIDVARHRLRQKLGLGKDENLVAFLSQF